MWYNEKTMYSESKSSNIDSNSKNMSFSEEELKAIFNRTADTSTLQRWRAMIHSVYQTRTQFEAKEHSDQENTYRFRMIQREVKQIEREETVRKQRILLIAAITLGMSAVIFFTDKFANNKSSNDVKTIESITTNNEDNFN